MRISAEQALIIKQTARQHFGEKACVLLFGSRTDDTTCGGDIDSLIETPDAPANAFRQSLALEPALQIALDDQKFCGDATDCSAQTRTQKRN